MGLGWQHNYIILAQRWMYAQYKHKIFSWGWKGPVNKAVIDFSDHAMEYMDTSLAVVSNTGAVMWIPQVIVSSICSVQARNFPNDEHLCTLRVSFPDCSNLNSISWNKIWTCAGTCANQNYKIKSRSITSTQLSAHWLQTDKHLRLVMTLIALCCTRQSRAPNIPLHVLTSTFDLDPWPWPDLWAWP